MVNQSPPNSCASLNRPKKAHGDKYSFHPSLEFFGSPIVMQIKGQVNQSKSVFCAYFMRTQRVLEGSFLSWFVQLERTRRSWRFAEWIFNFHGLVFDSVHAKLFLFFLILCTQKYPWWRNLLSCKEWSHGAFNMVRNWQCTVLFWIWMEFSIGSVKLLSENWLKKPSLQIKTYTFQAWN